MRVTILQFLCENAFRYLHPFLFDTFIKAIVFFGYVFFFFDILLIVVKILHNEITIYTKSLWL